MEKYEIISENTPHIKFIAVHWFEGGGIVLVYDEITHEYKSYIRAYKGLDADGDIRYIAEWGNTFPLDAAKALFPYIQF